MGNIAIIFIVFSIGLVYWSRNDLRDPRSYGFYRFFAFETILILVLLNIKVWFDNPLSTMQIISWLFLTISIVPAAYGFYLLRKMGKPQGKIDETTKLINTGIYRYIRHPMYSSLLWFAIGIFLKKPSLSGLSLLIACLAFLIATARADEELTLRRFGSDYGEYMKKTKMFIPFIF